jgi:hypothetical protein
MPRLLTSLVATIGIAVLVCGAHAQTSKKPVVSEPIFVSYALPASVEDMTRQSAAVVIVRLTGETRTGQRYGLPETGYSSKLVDVLKTDPRLPSIGAELEIELPGGATEKSDEILSQPVQETDDLVTGHQYVVFLAWIESRQRFLPMWFWGGVYDVTRDQVHAADRGQGRREDRKRTSDLIQRIRAAAGPDTVSR